MRLYTPVGLAYPVTVTKLLRKPGDDIEQNAPLFTYKYLALNTEYDENTREDVERERSYFADFESEVEGSVTSLNIKVGQVLERRTEVADIKEPCKHEVQFGGMCADCGKDMTSIQYSTTKLNTERATINTVHGHTTLLVSQAEASKADEEAKRRLLDSRKLSLVVDLDQTIIQATVDPTVGEWQKDEANPNHDAVKHVQAFQLLDDGPGAKSCWYYIKLRPGLHDFLQTVSKYYELHIYTMATRAYATNIAKIVDPDHKLFGDRILSRDENGSLNSKNLKRLFPVDTKMVVIIDDRGDVWSWSPNLVKVPAYDFFVGIGDINSSFLPKRPELEARPAKPTKAGKADSVGTSSSSEETDGASSAPSKTSTPASTPPQANGDVSAVDHMMSMAGKQDEGTIKEKAEEQDETIAAQLADRPLAQKQKVLDAADQDAKTSPAAEAAVELLSENGDKTEHSRNEPAKYRHNLLQDDDNELEYLGQSLHNIHQTYFDQYAMDSAAPVGGRVAELRPASSNKRSIDDLENIPDAAVIMARMKSKVLANVHLVFSGVVPLGVDIQSHDIAVWAKSFGATVGENITRRSTHVIASPERRTAKVRQAAKKGGRIAIVNQNWLYACFSQWRRVDEEPYRIHSEAPTNGTGSALPGSFESNEYASLCSSSDEEAAQTEEETDGAEIGTETPNGVRGAPPELEIDTDTDVEELAKVKPSEETKDNSPVEAVTDWDQINKDLDDFLGSDAEGASDTEGVSDTESVLSESTVPSSSALKTPPSQLKRKRDAVPAAAEDDGALLDGDGEDGSRLQKRKKEALGRTTSLTNMATAPTPDAGTAEQTAVDPGGGSTEVGPDDEDEDAADDDDLEAQLAAELENE